MKLTLGFSPCPNDTFIFDALVNGKMDLKGIHIEPYIADVEELNRLAREGVLDITKLSYHAFAHLGNKYALLHAGSALGNNCGPLLIARHELSDAEILAGPIAIPGRYTTANFLFSLAWPGARNTQEMLFSEIEQAVASSRVTAGLIIHENRFTYQDKGLVKIRDLGEYWEESTGLPIPLGGIAIRRDIPEHIQVLVDQLVAQSVRQARANPLDTMDYVKAYAQEMDPEVMMSHIRLYVNGYTEQLGSLGEQAVNHLMSEAVRQGVVSENTLPHQLFCPS